MTHELRMRALLALAVSLLTIIAVELWFIGDKVYELVEVLR